MTARTTPPHLTRRSFLRASGTGLAALAVARLLAACGRGEDADQESSFDWAAQERAGTLTFVNWPLYIDKKKVEGEVVRPTLDDFTEETGIEVEYLELIEDYASFFGKIEPQLAAGRSLGYDLIVMGYPKWLPIMLASDFVLPLDHTYLPTFAKHAAPKYKEAPYDPGNRYSIPYQSGITGIGYNIEMTGREITSVQDLFSPDFQGRVGMFRDTEDTPNMALIAAGVNPPDATEQDWRTAADMLLDQRERGLIRQYFGQGYINALQNGEVALTLAWSADVLQSINSGYDNLRFVVPEEGGLLWTDSLLIPVGAEHPVDAITFMDFLYHPKVAAQLTAWIQNVSPVPAAQEVLRDRGMGEIADNALIFPTDAMYERLRAYRVLSVEEQERWDDLFLPIYQA